MSVACVREAMKDKKFKFLRQGTIKRLEADYEKMMDVYNKRGKSVEDAQLAASAFYNREMAIIQKKNLNAKKQIAANKSGYEKLNNRYVEKKALWDAAIGKAKWKHFVAWMGYKPSLSREMNDHLIMMENKSNAHMMHTKNEMVEALELYQPNAFGVITKETNEIMEGVMRAAAGETDNIPDKLIQSGNSLRKALDNLAQRYRDAGGVMGHLENWLPQIHNSAAVRSDKELWKKTIIQRVDWDKVVDNYGFPAFSKVDIAEGRYSQEFIDFLDDVFDTISTDGANKVSKAAQEGKGVKRAGSMATKHLDSRVLHFKSVSDQLEYNKLFGSEDTFMSIMNHVQSMSREISLMETMGPRPQSFVDHMDAMIKGRQITERNKARENLAALKGLDTPDPDKIAKAEAELKAAELELTKKGEEGLSDFTKKMYDVAIGRTAMTGSESQAYLLLKATQAYLRGTQLGSAVIPALGDSMFAATALKMNGLDNESGVIGGIGKYMMAGVVNNKDLANFRVYLLEANNGNMLHRFFDGDSPVQKGDRISDKALAGLTNYASLSLKFSGLTGLTSHGKNFASLELFGSVGTMQKKAWKELDSDFREFLERQGDFTEADWAVIQKAQATKTDDGRASFLFPSDVAKLDTNIAVKYEAVSQRLRMLATNEPDIRTKAITTGGLKSGTVGRSVVDMVAMYRSFPITMMNNYIRPLADRAVMNGDSQLGQTLFATALAGYMILNLKDAIKGVENEDGLAGNSYLRKVDGQTMAASLLQGGGLGIFGDFMLQDYSRYGQSLEKTAAGPTFAFFNDVLRLAYTAGSPEKDADFTGFVKKYMPFRSMWWKNSALEYTIGDEFSKFIDSEHHYKTEAKRREYLMNQGQRPR